MKIAVVGTGGVGGYFGGRLAQADCDILFVATPNAAAEMAANGLTVHSILGDFHVDAPRVCSSCEGMTPVDLIIFTVKMMHLRAAAENVRPLVGPQTLLLPLENGIEAPDILVELFGADNVLGGFCRIWAAKGAPATIHHTGANPALYFGERSGGVSARVRMVAAELGRASHVTVLADENFLVEMWEKFLFVTPLGAVGAATDLTSGRLRTLPETRRLLEDCIAEFAHVAQASGITLSDDIVARILSHVDKQPEGATTSMQRDLADGKPSEFDFQLGTIIRLAARHGVTVPVSRALYAVLLSEATASTP